MHRRERILWSCFIAACLVAAPVLWFVDPEQVDWMPKCMVHTLTGLQCPGCGITRATHALLHGDLLRALSYNWFFVISVPYFLAACAVNFVPALRCRQRLYRAVCGMPLAVTYTVLFSLWFVVRNILGI